MGILVYLFRSLTSYHYYKTSEKQIYTAVNGIRSKGLQVKRSPSQKVYKSVPQVKRSPSQKVYKSKDPQVKTFPVKRGINYKHDKARNHVGLETRGKIFLY